MKYQLDGMQVVTRTKKLGGWVANNWRPYSTQKEASHPFKVSVRKVVSRTRGNEIEEELKNILQVDQVDYSMPQVFQQRNAALSIVMDRMSTEDRAEMEQVATEWSNQGYPEELRRR